MTKTFLMGSLAALSLITVAGVVQAEQAAGPAAHQARGDADGDGRISQTEFVQQRVARLTAADTNRDGSLSVEERQAAMQAHRAERGAERFDRIDTDSNGAISRTEFDAAHSGRMQGHRGRSGERGGRMGARQNANSPVVIAQARTKAMETFAAMDADRDGYVTADERRASMQQHRSQRHERMMERRSGRQASSSTPASE